MKQNWLLSRVLSVALVAGMTAALGAANPANAAGTVYYVSPTGSDANPGTEALPWRTAAKAAASLAAGDTAVFEDGVYAETAKATFANSGTAGAPITIKARNKHQAVLRYSGLGTTSKIVLSSKQYVVIQDLEITQDVKGGSSADTFIDSVNSSNITFAGNKIHNATGRAISAYLGDSVVVDQNVIFDFAGQGVYLTNVGAPVVKSNDIGEVANAAIYVARGTRSAQIFDNYVHTSVSTMSFGLLLGGTTSATGSYDPAGYEAYNATAWNNKIISEVAGQIQSAVAFAGSTDSGFYHNVVVGSQYGVRTMNGGGSTAGWQPVPTNPTLKNNIFVGLTSNPQVFSNPPVNFVSDFNLYYAGIKPAPVEAHGVYADPKFAANYTDLNLQWDSPAVGAGTPLSVTGFSGETVDVSIDVAGTQRTGAAWNLGVYANALPQPPDAPPNPITVGPVLFSEDFESGTSSLTTRFGNWGVVDETPGGNKVLTQVDASATSGAAKVLAGSPDWQDYAVDLRVNFQTFFGSGSYLTLYGRHGDDTDQDYYLVEMKGNPAAGYLALKRKVAGIALPLDEKLDWVPTAGWHNLKFVLNGPQLEFWMDGSLMLSATDTKLTAGRMGAQVYRTGALLDDIVVTGIDNPITPVPPAPLPAPGGTYYVSPAGSDSNDGSLTSPWKTMAYAAERAQAGDTVIFEDGVYEENRVAFFERSGTENARITFKARNKRKAIIKYISMPTSKIFIYGQSYITLQDFEITQDRIGIDTNDILVRVIKGSNHVNIVGNWVHHGYEDGVKGNLIHDYLVEGNLIQDIFHEGVDFVNVWDSVVRDNETYDVARVPLMVKGGVQDLQIYNNYVHNRNVTSIYGLTIGGQTGWDSAKDYSANGFEAWNVVAYNNVIVSDVPGAITNGITFMGSKDSAAYNNVVSGSQYDVRVMVPINKNVGWAWNPDNVNPVFKNNILINSTANAVGIVNTWDAPVNMTNDHNLYFGNAAEPTEAHGVYGVNPTFADFAGGDWHLAYGSPAIDAGETIAPFVLRDGVRTYDVSKDRAGVQRSAPWEIGVFEYAPVVNDKPFVYTIGDSTMSPYPDYRAPLTGWGVPFSTMFDASVTVKNYGESGYSSKMYWDNGRFVKTETNIKPGDYLFISFGHNDRSTDPVKHTEPFTTYKEYLTKYVAAARAHGAIPILVTSTNELYFNTDGTLSMTLGDYPVAMRQLAGELNVPLIDFNATSKVLYEKLGPVGTQKLFLWLEPGESPNYPNGIHDRTHFRVEGATYYADLAQQGVKALKLPLARKITWSPIATPTTTADIEGTLGANGWYTSNPTVTLSATSDSRSAVARTEYQLSAETAGAGSTPSTAGFVTYTSPITLNDGVYVLGYRSLDIFGNQETDATSQIMVDTTAPTLSVTVDKPELFPPNGSMVTVTVTATSADSTSGLASVVLTSITCNDGCVGDIIANIGSTDTTFQVRREHDGAATDRVYTVMYTATDNAGNQTTATATVTVPANSSGGSFAPPAPHVSK